MTKHATPWVGSSSQVFGVNLPLSRTRPTVVLVSLMNVSPPRIPLSDEVWERRTSQVEGPFLSVTPFLDVPLNYHGIPLHASL